MRVCPECREEYIASAQRCVTCDVPLVASEGFVRVGGPRELPPVAQLVCVRTATLSFAQALSERLAQAGITHRLESEPDSREGETQLRRPDTMPYGIYVREQDLDAAREVDRAHMRSEFPDLPDVPEGGSVVDGCPACGAAAAPDATECPDCGLALLDPA